MWRFALKNSIRLQFKRGHAPLIINYLIRVWQGHLGDNRCVYIYLCASLSNYLSFCNIVDYFLTFWREEVPILLGKCMYKLNAYEVNISCNLTVWLIRRPPPPPARFCQRTEKLVFSYSHFFPTKIRMYKIYVILIFIDLLLYFPIVNKFYPCKYQENTLCMQYSTSSSNPTTEYVIKRLWMWIFY